MPESGSTTGTVERRRAGRPKLRVLSLEEAAGMIADLADLKLPAVMRHVASRPVLFFFPHATAVDPSQGEWRIPERDVWALLGQEAELLAPRTVARRVEVSTRTIVRGMRAGAVGCVTFMGHKRVPRSEFYRLVREGRGKQPRTVPAAAADFSFSAKPGAAGTRKTDAVCGTNGRRNAGGGR